MTRYLVAATKPWNSRAFAEKTAHLPGEWKLVTEKDALIPEMLADYAPRYIFFPHWSWMVPKAVLEQYECVCFHMTDVPYGRGGSPLQNLIARNHSTTKLTALRMTEELDAGPVYAKQEMTLEGCAQEIYERVAYAVYDIIATIVRDEPSPVPQQGEVVSFERRTPAMSELPEKADAKGLYDHIRMLDAATYPPAYLDYGNHRFYFTQAELGDNGAVIARVEIKEKDL